MPKQQRRAQPQQNKFWIKGAIPHPGALKRAAKRHHQSTNAEIKTEQHSRNPRIRARGKLAARLTTYRQKRAKK